MVLPPRSGGPVSLHFQHKATFMFTVPCWHKYFVRPFGGDDCHVICAGGISA
jgi:hypothetical protein